MEERHPPYFISCFLNGKWISRIKFEDMEDIKRNTTV